MRDQFLEEKRKFVHFMNESKRVIEQIKAGHFRGAFEDATYYQSLEYLKLSMDGVFKYF